MVKYKGIGERVLSWMLVVVIIGFQTMAFAAVEVPANIAQAACRHLFVAFYRMFVCALERLFQYHFPVTFYAKLRCAVGAEIMAACTGHLVNLLPPGPLRLEFGIRLFVLFASHNYRMIF